MANANTGMMSRQTGSDVIKKTWKEADKKNKQGLPEGMSGTWIPWRVVDIDQTILPRKKVDADAVTEYSEILDVLPPIKVQANTLKLIAGRHRLEATVAAGQELIRAEIIEVADGEPIIDLAFKDNKGHGVRYRREDRRNYAMLKLRAYPDWTNEKLTQETGLSPRTIATIRASLVEDAKKSGENPETVAPKTRVGADGKTRKVGGGRPSNPPKVEATTRNPITEEPAGTGSVEEEMNRVMMGAETAKTRPPSTVNSPEAVLFDRISELTDYLPSLLVRTIPDYDLVRVNGRLDACREKCREWFDDIQKLMDSRLEGYTPKDSDKLPSEEALEADQNEDPETISEDEDESPAVEYAGEESIEQGFEGESEDEDGVESEQSDDEEENFPD